MKLYTTFNPCYPFTEELLNSFLQKNVTYFVRSTYCRGKDGEASKSFMISHYHDRFEAERHYNTIHRDENRFLYDVSNPDHIAKLKIAATEPEGYKIYSSLVAPGKDKEATKIFEENTKRYLYKNTNWSFSGKGRVSIIPKLYVQLGEIYTRISYEGETIRIKFTEIENS